MKMAVILKIAVVVYVHKVNGLATELRFAVANYGDAQSLAYFFKPKKHKIESVTIIETLSLF